LLKHVPELASQKEFTPDEMFEKSEQLLDESKTYKKIIESRDVIEQNYQLMNLKLLDFSATHTSNIRRILEQPIPPLNRAEFQRLFMEDKMWTTMKNAPDWLNKTWLSLHAFAQQTQK